MFDIFVNELNVQGGGVRAYEAAARAARARVPAEPENAAALLLISFVAQRFVDAYDDQPLTVEAAGEELERFRAIVEKLELARKAGSVEVMMAAVNEVALRIVKDR